MQNSSCVWHTSSTPSGKTLWVSFEAGVAQNHWCLTFKMCLVTGGLRGFLRDYVVNVAMADLG